MGSTVWEGKRPPDRHQPREYRADVRGTSRSRRARSPPLEVDRRRHRSSDQSTHEDFSQVLKLSTPFTNGPQTARWGWKKPMTPRVAPSSSRAGYSPMLMQQHAPWQTMPANPSIQRLHENQPVSSIYAPIPNSVTSGPCAFEANSAQYFVTDYASAHSNSLTYAGEDLEMGRLPQRYLCREGVHTSAPTAGSGPPPHLEQRKAMRKAASKPATVTERSLKHMKSAQSTEDGSSEERAGLLGVLIENWFVSWMFIFIPIGIASYWFKWGCVAVFCCNFVAIIPQAWIMGKATEDLAATAGSIVGGLLNAWFGNIVEMLLCIAGLRQGELVVVRCTLLGSILSNLLLVTGCSLLAGGLKYKIQQFSAIGASTTTSLLMLGTLCAGLPTMYSTILVGESGEALMMSRYVSFFLIGLYFQFMIFQLNTHSFLYNDGEEEDSDLSPFVAGVILLVFTVCCTFNSEYLISSIHGVVSSFSLSKEFIGIILLPIIGNAAEHYTSVVVALANKMDLSLGCAVGSSCQMLLFVTPMSVLSAWILGQPMSLDLHAFEVVVLLISVIIIAGILQDGYSNWLEGSILVTAYLVIALVFFCEDPKFSNII